MKKMPIYLISLTVDNNRYGANHKVYCSRIMKIMAVDEKDAYYIAAMTLKKEPRYKHAKIRAYDNFGSHGTSSWSINFKAWTHAPEEEK